MCVCIRARVCMCLCAITIRIYMYKIYKWGLMRHLPHNVTLIWRNNYLLIFVYIIHMNEFTSNLWAILCVPTLWIQIDIHYICHHHMIECYFILNSKSLKHIMIYLNVYPFMYSKWVCIVLLLIYRYKIKS